MRKTISLLINEDECTHVSSSSESFSIDRIRTKFETICISERNKSVSENFSLVGNSYQQKSSTHGSGKDLTRYIVITLVLCTSHLKPLFSEINTKKRLQEELSKLGKMPQKDLIKFDLLWSPESAEQYLSNSELLAKYTDMMRLF